MTHSSLVRAGMLSRGDAILLDGQVWHVVASSADDDAQLDAVLRRALQMTDWTVRVRVRLRRESDDRYESREWPARQEIECVSVASVSKQRQPDLGDRVGVRLPDAGGDAFGVVTGRWPVGGKLVIKVLIDAQEVNFSARDVWIVEDAATGKPPVSSPG